MKILNTYEHKDLGTLLCIGEEENKPSCWMKKERLKVFSNIEEEIEVYFNLYCFNINFERTGSVRYLEKTKYVEENIIKSYKAFLKGIEYIENEVIRFYNCGEFREEYYPYYKEESFNEELPRVNTIEDIYPYIEDKKVSIYRDGYGVAFKLKFGWMALMSRRVNIFDEDGGYTFTDCIVDAEEVSMDYM